MSDADTRWLRRVGKNYFLSLDTGYEEAKTYTPTYQGSTLAGATTYTTQAGFYQRVLSLVFVTGTLVWTAATGTGNAKISLPFASANVANQSFSGSARLINVTFANSTPTIELAPNSNFFLLHSPATNAAGAYVQMEAAGNLIFSLFYFLS
jgi:hypothetical protein